MGRFGETPGSYVVTLGLNDSSFDQEHSSPPCPSSSLDRGVLPGTVLEPSQTFSWQVGKGREPRDKVGVILLFPLVYFREGLICQELSHTHTQLFLTVISERWHILKRFRRHCFLVCDSPNLLVLHNRESRPPIFRFQFHSRPNKKRLPTVSS